MTFSIIVPVYNVERYLVKCLDSILQQSDADFEVIVVNDGSPDGSQKIIDTYAAQYPAQIKAYLKDNGGLSDARNYGIQQAQGEYLLFVDADDYIAPDLLAKLQKIVAQKQPDLIRFHACTVSESGEQEMTLAAPIISEQPGEKALEMLVDHKQYFEPACFYAYRKAFWLEQGFRFAKGKYHEDFGLIPEIIIKSAMITTLDYVGYYYVQSPGSITRVASRERDNKKAMDYIFHFDHLMEVANQCIRDTAVLRKFRSYLANSLIAQIQRVSGDTKPIYMNEIRKRRVFDLLLADNWKRMLKKWILKIRYQRPVKEMQS